MPDDARDRDRMSLETIVETICDMPHDGDVTGAETVTITTPDGVWEVDLCTDHAAKFLLPVIATGRPQRKTRATRAARSPVAV